MKKLLLPTLLLALLCACAGEKAPVPYTAAHGEVLLSQGLFDEGLAPVDVSVAAAVYGLDRESIEDGLCYMSTNTSVSADELTILILKDEDAAIAAEEACRGRVEKQIAVSETYAPAAVPRLEGAVISRVGNTVLLAVGDPGKLPDAVSALN